ncbi:MAG: hypothetical protein CSA13_01945 [Clostridiales bacterium]|nr:MAG: hypothetical protein CSA13_01945 [Clostridiales bacterium]
MRLNKKIFAILLVLCLTATTLSGFAEGALPIGKTDIRFVIGSSSYTVNGAAMTMDTAPLIKYGRTLLPIRYVATPLGAAVGWDGVERKVTVELSGTKIEMWIDNPTARVNGSNVPIDAEDNNVKPIIVDNRTMLPIRFVSEQLKCAVGWDEIKREVQISKSNLAVRPDIYNVSKEDEDPNQGAKKPIDNIKPVEVVEDSALGTGHLLDGLKKADPTLQIISVTKKTPIYEKKNDDLIDQLRYDFQASIDFMSKLKTIPAEDWKDTPPGQARAVNTSEVDLPIVLRLGRGYNVFGKLASVDSLKNAVLDINKLVADQRVERIRFDSADNQQTVAESIKKYSEKMSAKAKASGRYFLFGGSASSNFSSERTQELNTYFSTYTYLVKKYGVYITATTNLKDYLLPEVKQFINDPNRSADDVFGNYGQYILIDSITGGRVDYSISAKANKSTSFENFSMATKAGFNALVMSIGGEAALSKIKNREQFDSSKDERLTSQGGAMGLSLGQFINDPQTLTNWEATLEENGTLIDFGETGARALIPIWELCDDPQRADYLKAEFEKINAAQEQQWPTQKYVADITFVVSRRPDSARNKCPAGYYLIDRDLNKGAHGKFIYLCYKLSEDRSQAITDLFLEYSRHGFGAETLPTSHNSHVADYTRIPVDLNTGAGGNFIYLWTTKAPTREPLTALEVIYSPPNASHEEWQFVKWHNGSDPADVNRSVGGNFVTILFQR